MSKIPNGVQTHVLWQMDGRTWIETKIDREESRTFKLALERGWVKYIPQEKLEEFLKHL